MAAAPPSPNNPKVVLFLEWLCTPRAEREPSNQAEFAAMLGMSETTLREWKKDPGFLALWEAQYRKTVGSPDRVQQILDALFRTATDESDPRQVPAARAYFQAIEDAKPKGPQTVAQAKELSNEKLMEILAERASAELTKRG